MTTKNTLSLIRTADPYAAAAPATDRAERMDAALERLLADPPAEAATPSPAGRLAGAPHRHRARTLGVALATAAACGAGLIAALPGANDNAPGVQAASAATVLSSARAAALEADQPGPWTAMTTREWRNHPFKLADGSWGVALIPYTSEQWSSDEGEQLRRTTRGTDVQFPRASDAATYKPPAWPREQATDGKFVRLDSDANNGSWTVAEVHALPTDPTALAAALAKGIGAEPGSKFKPSVVMQAAGLLQSSLPTAEQRAALYTVLQRTPGAQLIPSLTDPEGRTGEGVRFVKPNPPTTEAPGGYDITLLFDRETHALLGERQDSDWSETIGRKLSSWSLVLDARRAEVAPKPELEWHYPADWKKTGPELVPIG